MTSQFYKSTTMSLSTNKATTKIFSNILLKTSSSFQISQYNLAKKKKKKNANIPKNNHKKISNAVNF